MKRCVLKTLPVAILFALGLPPPAHAITDAERDQLTTYTTMIGRGIVCGVDIHVAVGRVGKWIDRIAPKGSEDQGQVLMIFMTG